MLACTDVDCIFVYVGTILSKECGPVRVASGKRIQTPALRYYQTRAMMRPRRLAMSDAHNSQLKSHMS